MTRPPSVTALVVYQTLAAVGVFAWWIYWFAAGKNHGAGCPTEYENAFPVGDLVMAALWLVTAWAGWLGGRGFSVAAVGGGMGLSLMGIDTTHNVLIGAFAEFNGTVVQKLLFAVVNGSVGFLAVFVTTRHRRWYNAPTEPPSWTGSMLVAAVSTFLVFAGTLGATTENCLPVFARSFLAPGVVVLAAGLLALVRQAWSRSVSLAVAGSVIHATLLWVLVAHDGTLPPMLPMITFVSLVGAIGGIAYLRK